MSFPIVLQFAAPFPSFWGNYQTIRLKSCFMAIAILAGNEVAYGQSECDSALIQSSYSESSRYHKDWRLAKFVDQEAYNKLKSDIGASGTIYGVPVGANFAEFKEHYSRLESRYQESLTIDQARQVFWQGLGIQSATAYTACLQFRVFNEPGLRAAVVSSTDQAVTVKIRWYNPAYLKPIDVSWTPKIPQLGGLPRRINVGDRLVQIPRPAQVIPDIAVNGEVPGGGSFAASIPLKPLPAALPEAPCVRQNQNGQCLKCAGEYSLIGMPRGNMHPFVCPGMMAGTAYTFMTSGRVQTDRGRGPWIIMTITGPDGGTVDSGNLQGMERESLPFTMVRGPVRASGTMISGGVTISHCQAEGQQTCSISDGKWQICSSQIECKQ